MHVRMPVLYPAHEVRAFARPKAPAKREGVGSAVGPFMRPETGRDSSPRGCERGCGEPHGNTARQARHGTAGTDSQAPPVSENTIMTFIYHQNGKTTQKANGDTIMTFSCRRRLVKSRETTVHEIYNGMSATALPQVTWQKSRRSNSQGNCVEMARLSADSVAVRNSRHPEGPALIYTRAEIEALILGAKDGDFDNLFQ